VDCTINDLGDQKKELADTAGCWSYMGEKDERVVGEGGFWQAARHEEQLGAELRRKGRQE
jgi:hypothetical protein